MNYIEGLVSVVIPTYKRADSLGKTIESVLGQTYREIEVLVVNDNIIGDEYSESLYELLGKIPDERIKLVEQERHINGAAARNAGIRAARGEYISFLDDDDTWEKEKIEHQLKILETLDDSWGAVSCLMKTYKNGQLMRCSLPYRSGSILLDVLRRRTGLGMGSLLIRRKALDQCGYFDEKLNRHQDLQLFACLTEKYKVQLDPVYLYNIETGDAQNRPSAVKLVQIKKDYFSSIKTIIDQLPAREQKLIYALHSFEQAYAFSKEHNKGEAEKRILAILQSPKAIYFSIERIVRKTIEAKCKTILINMFSIQRK